MGAETSFIGRHDDMATVRELLRAHRLITITGPGGIGKTRLAEELANTGSNAYPGGVFIVALGTASQDDDAETLAARQLGHGSIEAFTVGAANNPTLVVVDNCEHVLPGARSLIEQLLADPDIAVMATSRIPVAIEGERVVALDPLPLPDGSHTINAAALQLFLERAAAAGAQWPHTDHNLEAAAEIVRRVDGIPLAIELAAARTRILAPGQLVELLARQLDLLDQTVESQGGRRGIRSAIVTSYEPLDPRPQRLLRRLGFLPAPGDLDLVHAVAGDDDPIETLDLLTQLVEQSLVQALHDSEGNTRYRLLEPIRAFALEQLDVVGEQAAATEQYITAMTSFADEVVALSTTRFSADVIDRIADRHSHLIRALELALAHDPDPSRAYRLFLPFYAPTRASRQETADLGSRIRQHWADAEAPFQPEAYAVMAHTAGWAGRPESVELAEMALAMAESSALARAICGRVLAFTSAQAERREEALTHIENAVTEAASFGGSFHRELRVSWASLIDDSGRRSEALGLLESTAAEAAEFEETVTLVWAAITSAHHQLLDKNLEAARRSAGRAQELAVRTGAPWATCAAHRVMGSVRVFEHDWDSALLSWRESFEGVVAIGDLEGVALTLRTTAASAEYARHTDIAEEFWRIVPSRPGLSTLPPLFDQQITDLRERLGPPHAMTLSESVRTARRLFARLAKSDDDATTSVALGHQAPYIRFGLHEIDIERRELRRGAEPVHVEPQVFDVLVYLARRPGEIVTKEELLDEVWGSRFVSASALTTRIKSARAATGDDGTAQKVIRTVHGRGFMWVAELR